MGDPSFKSVQMPVCARVLDSRRGQTTVVILTMILIMSFVGRIAKKTFAAVLVVSGTALLVGCGSSDGNNASSGSGPASQLSLVVTHAVLGAQVSELVGSAAQVTVLMPNGADPHDWSPSAKDIEKVMSADLIVRNGLGLEARLDSPLDQAKSDGVAVFTVADHVTLRSGADPHLWMDPVITKEFMGPLAEELRDLGLDVTAELPRVEVSLDQLNADVAALLDSVPFARRRLVTGHESLGYFAERYGYELIGAVVPSFSSQTETSAGALADLVAIVKREGVPAIFTEVGTPVATVESISQDSGAEVIELQTHRLPEDGSYGTFMIDLATLISTALR